MSNILKSKIQIYKNYHVGDETIDNWWFWLFEENIKIINDLNKEESKAQKKQEEEQKKSMPSMKTPSVKNSMSSMGNMSKKFGR